MGARGRWVGWACVGLLLCSGCGRIGFELLSADKQPSRPSTKKPKARDAAVAASVDGAIDASADAAVDASQSQIDAGADAGPPRSAMDASLDAMPGANLDGGARDSASSDSASSDASQLTDAADMVDAATADASPDSGVPACTTTQVADYCAQLPHLPVVPTIDGRLECDLQLVDLTPAGWTNGTSPMPVGNSARFAAAWREEGIYFFIDVTDATRLPPASGSDVWCGDGPELYIDADGSYTAAPNYDSPGTIQLLATAPADDTTPVNTGGKRWRAPLTAAVGPWSSPRYGAFPRAGGYVFEAFIQADDLDLTSWTLVSGAAVGLDLAINVSVSSDPPPAGETPECGNRLGQYFLRIAPAPCTPSCFPFQNVAAFCAPALRD